MENMNEELKNKIMIVLLMVAAGFAAFGFAYAKNVTFTGQDSSLNSEKSIQTMSE